VAVAFDEFVAAVAAEKRERAALPDVVPLDVMEPMMRWNLELFVDTYLSGGHRMVSRRSSGARPATTPPVPLTGETLRPHDGLPGGRSAMARVLLKRPGRLRLRGLEVTYRQVPPAIYEINKPRA